MQYETRRKSIVAEKEVLLSKSKCLKGYYHFKNGSD